MTEKDYNQLIMSFFYDSTIRDFGEIYQQYKKEGKQVELQGMLNHLIKIGFIERTKSDNFRQTPLLYELLLDRGFGYWGQPYSYYLSKQKGKFNYEKWTFRIGVILGTAIALTALIVSLCKK